ncbi:hypothetical protein GCM10025870_27950 [Agromyces marinus]|uniref:Uncharacterized protein n=2 Tax=Agromyces marinus TaxID=1389020 RepID=A0ABN6YE45_9MICO|nr:hypothetical protein GCM10025870_27950 [Agromyces marinus]
MSVESSGDKPAGGTGSGRYLSSPLGPRNRDAPNGAQVRRCPRIVWRRTRFGSIPPPPFRRTHRPQAQEPHRRRPARRRGRARGRACRGRRRARPGRLARRARLLGRRLRRGGAKNVMVMSVAAGIVGTLAIPAYAFAPGTDGIQYGATAETQLTRAAAQDVVVADEVIAAPISEDSYAAVTAEEIRAAEEAERAAEAAAEAARQAAAAEMTSYAAAASEYTPAAVYGSADPASVFSVAQQYLGVPYVYGGATPPDSTARDSCSTSTPSSGSASRTRRRGRAPPAPRSRSRRRFPATWS